jgi:hypothetical protein
VAPGEAGASGCLSWLDAHAKCDRHFHSGFLSKDQVVLVHSQFGTFEMVQDRVERFEVWLQSRLSGFPDCVVVNSMAGLEHGVSSGIPREKMLFIPNGIDTNVFYPDEAEGQRVRADWGISESAKIIGKIARFKSHQKSSGVLAGRRAHRSRALGCVLCVRRARP